MIKFSPDSYRLLMYQAGTGPFLVAFPCSELTTVILLVTLMKWLTCQSSTLEVSGCIESNIGGPCGKAETL